MAFDKEPVLNWNILLFGACLTSSAVPDRSAGWISAECNACLLLKRNNGHGVKTFCTPQNAVRFYYGEYALWNEECYSR